MNSPALKYVEFQDKITSIGNLACFTNSTSLTVVCRAATPPSLGTGNNSFGDSAVNRINVYVPNESIVTYRERSVWSNLRRKIYGFVSGPIEIMKDGQYPYKLQSYFSSATDFSLTLQQNDYLSMEFSNGVGVVTATGITPDIEGETVNMSYEFYFKGVQYSGTFEIVLKYKETIDFEDDEVKRICVANWGGEYSSTNLYGVPGELTYEQAAAVTSIVGVFNGNTKITSFMELQYFTALRNLSGSTNSAIIFYNCRNLKRVKLPEGVTRCQNIFRNCASLVFIELPSTLTGTDAIRYYTFGGNPSTPANKKLVVHFNSPLTLTPGTSGYGSTTGTFNRGIYVPDEHIDEFRAADVWKNNNIYPLSEWDGTT